MYEDDFELKVHMVLGPLYINGTMREYANDKGIEVLSSFGIEVLLHLLLLLLMVIMMIYVHSYRPQMMIYVISLYLMLPPRASLKLDRYRWTAIRGKGIYSMIQLAANILVQSHRQRWWHFCAQGWDLSIVSMLSKTSSCMLYSSLWLWMAFFAR